MAKSELLEGKTRKIGREWLRQWRNGTSKCLSSPRSYLTAAIVTTISCSLDVRISNSLITKAFSHRKAKKIKEEPSSHLSQHKPQEAVRSLCSVCCVLLEEETKKHWCEEMKK
ncbi:hypothetical protein CFP56_023449 [Quercus suber]|uniref:Uncharacterized protein n=1 Tax=Quercus suber TaxID=58331 RepID=A0AAW0K8H0_QUESU